MSIQHSAANSALLARDDRLQFRGDWTLANYAALRSIIAGLSVSERGLTPDFTAVERLDTAGAYLIVSLIGPERLIANLNDNPLPRERHRLLQAACHAYPSDVSRPSETGNIRRALGNTGQQVVALGHLQWRLAGFIGQVLAILGTIAFRPSKWRLTPFVAAVHDTGLNALPIVALLTFLVGAVVAFLGATVLNTFGATIYTVDLVAFSFFREFGVLLAAILLAGRTASAFTAHIGSMKVNEEIDALRTLGLNPIELLVVPRVLAMMVSLPALTFVGVLCGLLGGAAVCALSLDIPPTQFIAIIERDIALTHFLVGMAKAPVFAFLIAVIGCLEGFKVSGSAQSVGEHTTSSVVQSIFMVILLDSIAALFFLEMGW